MRGGRRHTRVVLFCPVPPRYSTMRHIMMNNDMDLVPRKNAAETPQSLDDALQQALRDLNDAETLLTSEQAAVNAFRMQCRLKLGDLIDTVLELQEQQQSLLTELALWRQGVKPAGIFDEPPPEDPLVEELHASDPALSFPLPRPTPRDRQAEKRLYRELARRFHPDLAGASAERAYATSIMAAVNTAYAAGDVGTLRDLAGELDPEEIAALELIEARDVRRLRERLLKLRRRKRRALSQLQSLRQDSTAQLWRRARQMGEEGLPWWVEVQAELRRAIDQLTEANARLQQSVDELDSTSR